MDLPYREVEVWYEYAADGGDREWLLLILLGLLALGAGAVWGLRQIREYSAPGGNPPCGSNKRALNHNSGFSDDAEEVDVSVMRRMLLIVSVWGLSACSAPNPSASRTPSLPVHQPSTAPGPTRQERPVTAIIDFYDEGAHDVITAPNTVQVGEAFQVTVNTYGGGCERAGGAQVRVEGNIATLSVYDYTTAGPNVACPALLQRLPRTVAVTFGEPGEAIIRVAGLRVGRETPPEGIPITIEKRITVQ